MSIQVRDLITRLQQMPDQTAQVFIGAKIHDGEDVVELPLDFPDICPWNPAKVHIRLDPDLIEESLIKEHRAYTDLEERVEDLEEELHEVKLDCKQEKENAGQLKSALASIRREVDSVIDRD